MREAYKEIKKEKLNVKIFDNRADMGFGAAKDVSAKIKDLLQSGRKEVNIIFAAAPSQQEFLEQLSNMNGIDWNRINAFHMDEYIGLNKDHPSRFGNFLKDMIFDKIPLHNVFYLNEDGVEPKVEIERYSRLLQLYPADIVCMGIGENAHIAFNDPHVADFNDENMVKVVKLDERSRQQQVHDNCFKDISEVPSLAVTLTVPALLNAKFVFCIVPGSNKAEAILHTLQEEIKEAFPSTSLRTHPNAKLYLDKDSGKKLN